MEAVTVAGVVTSAWGILDSIGLNPIALAQKEAGKRVTDYVKKLVTTKPTYKNRLAAIIEQLLAEYRTEYPAVANDGQFYFFQSAFLWETALTYELFEQDAPLRPEDFPVLPKMRPPTTAQLTEFSARLRAAMKADKELEKRFLEENYQSITVHFALAAQGQLQEVLAHTTELLARPDAQSIGLVNAVLDAIERDDLAAYKPVTAQRQLHNLERVITRYLSGEHALVARLYFLLGRTHQEMGEVVEADRYMVRAYLKQSDNLPYAEEAARAYVNQKQLPKAQAVLEKIERLDPFSAPAAAVQLALGKPDEFDQNLQAIPNSIAQDERFKLMALTLLADGTPRGEVAVNRLLESDLRSYRPSAHLTPENRRFQIILAMFVIERGLRQMSPVITLNEAPPQLDNADMRAAHKVLQQYTDLLQPTEKAPGLTHHYFMRGVAGWFLTTDITEYDELRRRFPSLPSAVRQRYANQFVFALYQAKEYEAVLEIIDLLDTRTIPEVGFLRYSALRQLKRPKEEARAALGQHLDELEHLDDFVFFRALVYLEHCDLVADRLAFVKKSIKRQQVPAGLPTLVLQAQALVADPDQQEEVRRLVDEANALLHPDTDTVYRQALATLYHELKDYEATAAVLEGWPGYPQSLEQGAEWLRLTNQYHRRSESAALREDLRAWRLRYGIFTEFCIWEIKLAEMLHDWSRILEVVEAATGHVTDASGLRWAKVLALYKSKRRTELQAELESILQNPAMLRRKHLFNAAAMAAHIGQLDWAQQLLYPLASRRDDRVARGKYIQLGLNQPRNSPPPPEYDQAALHTVVLYMVNGKPQRRITLTPETMDDGLSVWAKELLGKEKGKKYVMSHPTTGRNLTIELLEITDLHTGLFRDILDDVRAGDPELPFEQIEFGDGEIEQLHAALSSAMGAEGAARQVQNRQLFAEYASGQTTFSALAVAIFHGNALEAYQVLTEQRQPDVPGLVVSPRSLFASLFINPDSLFILDWTSLPLLHRLSKQSGIMPRAKLGISLHVVEFLEQKIEEMRRSQPIEITVEVIGDSVRPHFYPPEMHERHIAYLTELLMWIETHCITRIVAEKLDALRQASLQEGAHEEHTQYLVDTAFLAAAPDAMLVSDDSTFLQLSLRPGNTISTEAFLLALYSDEFETVIQPKLLDFHYIGLTISSSLLLQEFKAAGGQFTGRALQCLKCLPRQMLSEPGSMADVIVALREIYLMGSLLPAQKSRAATTILTACFTYLPLNQSILTLLKQFISLKFMLLPEPMRAVLKDMEQAWQIVAAYRD
jgi:hypothetical protein